MSMVDVQVERRPDGSMRIVTAIAPPPYNTVDPFMGKSVNSFGEKAEAVWQTNALRAMYGVNSRAKLEAGIAMLQLMVEAIDAKDEEQREAMRKLQEHARSLVASHGSGITATPSYGLAGQQLQRGAWTPSPEEIAAAKQAAANAAHRRQLGSAPRSETAMQVMSRMAAQAAKVEELNSLYPSSLYPSPADAPAEGKPKANPFINFFKETFR